MDRQPLGRRLRVALLLSTSLHLVGCHTETEVDQPLPDDFFTTPLEVRAFCVGTNILNEVPTDPLAIPNISCRDPFDNDEAWPISFVPDPSLVLLQVRNQRAVPITLTSIGFETDPAGNRQIDELLEFRERQGECLDWLSKPVTGIPPAQAWFAPKTLLPNETCYAVLGVIDPTALGTPPATGSVLFFGPKSMVLASIPISVGY